jgi:hypothetical protein
VPSYYDITVATAGTTPPISDKVFRITVLDAADAVIALSGSTVPESAAASTLVGTLSVANATGTPVYALTNNAGGLFAVANDQLLVAGALDYETAASHTITVAVTGTTPTPPDATFTITVTDVSEGIFFEQEFITPGEVYAPKPEGATSLTIECIGAGGPGCIGSAAGVATGFRQEFTPASFAGIEPIPPPQWVLDMFVARSDIEPPTGQWPITVPVEARGQPAFFEGIGAGGKGENGGGGGGAYSNKTRVIGPTESAVYCSIGDGSGSGAYTSVVSLDSMNFIFLALGGMSGSGGSAGGAALQPPYADVSWVGGNGSGMYIDGAGGSAAWANGPGNPNNGHVGGASPGLPAGKGGDTYQPGQPEGGGGGNFANGAPGWLAIDWNYTANVATAGGGGGGGAYASSTIVVDASLAGVYVTVPPPPPTNTQINGVDAKVQAGSGASGSILCSAAGGHHGVSQDVGDGLGGQAANCVGDVAYSGGNGFSAVTTGGAGGSAAWSSGNGNNAQGDTGGASPGAPAGAGGNNGAAGGSYGGGGGSSNSVGTGGGGYVKLTWT